MVTTTRRQLFNLGALALVSGSVQTSKAQTSSTTPDYTRLSNAVLNSHGLAVASVWKGINTGNLKSDDLIQAAFMVRLTSDHFGELELNDYINTQFTLRQNELFTGVQTSADVIHAIGEQIRSYGIVMTDTQIQNQHSSVDLNTQQQGVSYASTVGIRNLQIQIADSLDLSAKKLRFLEIATACGTLLDQVQSNRLSQLSSMQAGNQNQAVTLCSAAWASLEASWASIWFLENVLLAPWYVTAPLRLAYYLAEQNYHLSCG